MVGRGLLFALNTALLAAESRFLRIGLETSLFSLPASLGRNQKSFIVGGACSNLIGSEVER
jgi:hypothetical protein